MKFDATMIGLLRTRLALPPQSEVSPLKRRELFEVERALSAAERSPAELLTASAGELKELLACDEAFAQRVATLLQRSGPFAIELERLASRGIWLLTRADERYPIRWRETLGERAPDFVFGAGEPARMSSAAVAIVGSRNADSETLEFAGKMAQACARAQYGVVSGAARGVDRTAMNAALAAGSPAVGILAGDLPRVIREPGYRRCAAEGQLVLVTPTEDFAAPFTIGNAMARNKLIYGLAEFAVVAAAELENGGTWAGAKEDLSQRWKPLFVRADEPLLPGNAALLKAGALPLRTADFDGDCIALLRHRAATLVSRQENLYFGAP